MAGRVKIFYGGVEIASLGVGDVADLICAGKFTRNDISVRYMTGKKLTAPKISLEFGVDHVPYLKINSFDTKTKKFYWYANGAFKGVVTDGFNSWGLGEGTYEIKIKATARVYEDSDYSNIVTLKIADIEVNMDVTEDVEEVEIYGDYPIYHPDKPTYIGNDFGAGGARVFYFVYEVSGYYIGCDWDNPFVVDPNNEYYFYNWITNGVYAEASNGVDWYEMRTTDGSYHLIGIRNQLIVIRPFGGDDIVETNVREYMAIGNMKYPIHD